MKYLDDLNEIQRQAVTQIEGPVMIIAGPGSGKTRVLTYRIAHLMHQKVDPFSILALTFTNKAAREMKARIEQLRGMDARSLWMGTFHSVFARLLRVDAPRLGYPSNFTIYDTTDSKSLVKNIIKEQNLNDKLYKPNQVFFRISAAKNALIGPKEYASNAQLTSEDESSGRPKMAELYKLYTDRCFRAGAMDFDDLLYRTHELLVRFPEVLYKYQHRFRYVMIDEFQDTNTVQYAIVNKLAAVFQNIAVVGDDAQSIYSFRGATIANILNFEKDFPDLKIFKLEQNYRSTKVIVKAANEIIGKNSDQLAKEIWTENHAGDLIKVYRAMSDNEEGNIIAESIYELRNRNHLHNSEIAILYRTNAQSRSFEESLRKLNIPYRIYGGLSFYQRKEIKDLLAYLKLTINPKDEEALRRVINYPARGIGKTSMQRITILAEENQCSLWDIVENAARFDLGRSRTAIANFALMMKSFAAMLQQKDAYELASHIGRTTGLIRELYADKSIEGVSRYENIQELLNSIREFTDPTGEVTEGEEQPNDLSLGSYLQQVSLLTDQDEEKGGEDQVKLMTIHAAKGLEFKAVFVVGLEENLFPNMMSLNSREDLEEERRLFYVAITRAEKYLALSHAATRYRFGSLIYCEPSRFISELPEDHLQALGYKERKPGQVMRDRSNEQSARRAAARVKKPQYNYTHKASADFQADDPAKLSVGMQVEHSRFGFGKIVSMEGAPPNKLAVIFFQEMGQKKLLLKFAKLRIVQTAKTKNDH